MMPTAENMTAMNLANNELNMENCTDISYYAVTNVGGRSHNEDHYGHSCHENIVTFVVSDGIGGQAGGSIASEIVVEMIRQHAKSLERDEMLLGYQAIGQEILEQQQHSEYKMMGATVAELRIDFVRQKALWGHFGDSRIYWIRNNEINTVTKDHSVVKSLVDAGLISEREALHHPKKNVLLGAFGMAGDVTPEILEAPVYLANGDAFLLCTDGVWNSVSDQDILELLIISSNVEEWIKKLEAKIKEVSSNEKDNYTAIGVWITPSLEKTIQMKTS
jgi:serine/threonine protein phosphatase PrpC